MGLGNAVPISKRGLLVAWEERRLFELFIWRSKSSLCHKSIGGAIIGQKLAVNGFKRISSRWIFWNIMIPMWKTSDASVLILWWREASQTEANKGRGSQTIFAGSGCLLHCSSQCRSPPSTMVSVSQTSPTKWASSPSLSSPLPLTRFSEA